MEKNIFAEDDTYCCKTVKCFKKLILVLILVAPYYVNSQIIVGGGAVNANFGVDGDVYTDINTNIISPVSNLFNTDDWTSIAGNAVIANPTVTQLNNLLSNRNASEEIRMSVPYYSIIDNRYWIDAVFLRDQQTSGNNIDSNIFTSTSDKNFDNPNTWNIGPGNVPQKDDIIDVFGHLRRDGTTVLQDPEWGFFGVSTRNDNGDKHLDIEYFRAKVIKNGNSVTYPGLDGGRSAWVFASNGSATKLGDILISMDFTNGGSTPEGKIYIWIDLANKTTAYFDNFNTLPNIPFKFVKNGTSYVNYDGGEQAETFGYAQIELRDASLPTSVFSAFNFNDTVPAPAWKTIDSNGDISSNYTKETLTEFGFNLTALGLDSAASQVGCISPFGSFVIKTRASDSFLAELKDIAGPIDLGATLEVSVAIYGDTNINCLEASTILTAVPSPASNSFVYKWYKDDVLISGQTSNSLLVTQEGAYKVEATIVLGTTQGCTATDQKNVTVTPPFPIMVNCPSNYTTATCLTQELINTDFENWYNSFTFSGGTNVTVSMVVTDGLGNIVELGNPIIGPNSCGGEYRVALVANDDCGQSAQCSSTFTVPVPVLTSTTPLDFNASSCSYSNQVEVDAVYMNWISGFTTTGGCNPIITFSENAAPSYCGGSVTVTYTVSDRCSQPIVKSATFTITEATPLMINCPAAIELRCGDDFEKLFVEWINSFGFTGGCNPVATDLSSYVMPTEGQSLEIVYTVRDKCDVKECKSTFVVPICYQPHCSYTQGFYGNVNGNGCSPNGTLFRAQAIMATAVSSQPSNSYTFGSALTGNYFLLKLNDIIGKPRAQDNFIFKMLPGSGTPRKLVSWTTYDNFSTWADNDPLNASGNKKGAINNNLLSQTMTLFFNIYAADPSLANVVLKPLFVTADVKCGLTNPLPDTNQEFRIPEEVIDYLNNNYSGGGATVANLFKLANRVLGGEITSPSSSNVIIAVDAVNRGYDDCRVEISTNNQIAKFEEKELVNYESPKFKIYPVPFKDQINVVYEFDYKSNVTIQIFDAKGQLLMDQEDSNPYMNKIVTIQPVFNKGVGQFFIIKVITDQGVSVKKVISEK